MVAPNNNIEANIRVIFFTFVYPDQGSNLTIMMIPIQLKIVFLICISLMFAGCQNNRLNVDISNIEIDVPLERFDRAIFELDPDRTSASLEGSQATK